MSRNGSDQGVPAELHLAFESVDAAVAAAELAATGFGALLVKSLRAGGVNIYEPSLFVTSAITRATGLHQGVVTAIRDNNPHAAFPLLRAYIELVATVAYAVENPRYYRALMRSPRNRVAGDPKRQTMQALMHVAAKRFPGIRAPYAELCEIGHFGDKAYWMPFIYTPAEGRAPGEPLGRLSATNAPRWRDAQRDPLITCAYLIEFGEAFVECIEHIITRQLAPLGARPSDPEAPQP